MYLWGDCRDTESLSAAGMAQIIGEGKRKVPLLSAAPMSTILEVLDSVGKSWTEGSVFFNEALDLLAREQGLSSEMIRRTLLLLPGLLDRKVLERRIFGELGNAEALDRFVRKDGFEYRVRAFPRGVLFHVSAGNVFIGCIDSLLMGFLTKNVSILKMSSNNQAFPLLFARSLREADPKGIVADKFVMVHFEGGRSDIESVVKSQVDTIVAWGGEEMIRSYRQGLGLSTRLIEYGPKISFQAIFRDALEGIPLEECAGRIAADLCQWDQAACASPQNLFFEDGIDVGLLMDKLADALGRWSIPRGPLNEDEAVEIWKERYRAKWNRLLNQGAERAGTDYLLHFDPQPGLRPSPLHRTLILKRFRGLDDLSAQVGGLSSYLQSCSYLVPDSLREKFMTQLALYGVKRFAPLGTVMDGMAGTPHDGRYGLNELVQWIADENASGVVDFVGFVNEAIEKVPYYHRIRGGQPVRRMDELPFLTASELAQAPLSRSEDFVSPEVSGGYIFSSSGTSGQPKYTFYGFDEFRQVGRMLARGYRARGLKKGERVANLFVAGNLWSSFLAVDEALKELEVVQLPIGGNAETSVILEYLEVFCPRVVFGLPTQLVSLAEESVWSGRKIKIDTVFYAGEHLNDAAREVLKMHWGTQAFCSAGYASVDAGPIGYQCSHCEGTEHHLLSEFVHLELVDGEGVVTSLVRRKMPILRYRTGDRMEWCGSTGEKPKRCGCGSNEPKFVLLGRCDSQMNVWGCRLYVQDIEKALLAAGIVAPVFQVELDSREAGGQFLETLRVVVEAAGSSRSASEVVEEFYRNSPDLYKTHPLEHVKERMSVFFAETGVIKRAPRTGKVRAVVDRR